MIRVCHNQSVYSRLSESKHFLSTVICTCTSGSRPAFQYLTPNYCCSLWHFCGVLNFCSRINILDPLRWD